MRLWSLHPQYLDPRGLVALWREALLARAVLQSKTKGYRYHPQLTRFEAHATPRSAISVYLSGVHREAMNRGYRFDATKIGPVRTVESITVTTGQLAYEWEHLLRKLSARSPDHYRCWKQVRVPQCHPLFRVRTGGVEAWEVRGD